MRARGAGAADVASSVAAVPARRARADDLREAVRQAVGVAGELPEGPVGLQASFAISDKRPRVSSIWKCALDGLGPLLGLVNPHEKNNPLDDRIVRIGLHHRRDTAVGEHEVDATVIWATSASGGWPELAWLRAMSDTEREDYWRRYRARLARDQARPAPAARARRRRSQALPAGVVELEGADAFQAAVDEGASIINKERGRGPEAAHPPWAAHGPSTSTLREDRDRRRQAKRLLLPCRRLRCCAPGLAQPARLRDLQDDRRNRRRRGRPTVAVGVAEVGRASSSSRRSSSPSSRSRSRRRSSRSSEQHLSRSAGGFPATGAFCVRGRGRGTPGRTTAHAIPTSHISERRTSCETSPPPPCRGT